MKYLILILMIPGVAFADFASDAKIQSDRLKKNLMNNLTTQIKEKGVVAAVEFCHESALPLTDKAKSKKLKMGRTSLKVRNPKNTAPGWIKSYLQEASKTTSQNPFKEQVVVLKDKTTAFISPLYMAPQCLQCHGNPSGALKEKIDKLYPKDQATGYKAGEFRGFVWVTP